MKFAGWKTLRSFRNTDILQKQTWHIQKIWNNRIKQVLLFWMQWIYAVVLCIEIYWDKLTIHKKNPTTNDNESCFRRCKLYSIQWRRVLIKSKNACAWLWINVQTLPRGSTTAQKQQRCPATRLVTMTTSNNQWTSGFFVLATGTNQMFVVYKTVPWT